MAAIEVEIIKQVVADCARNGKYPMFNMHGGDLNYAKGNEGPFMSNLTGQGLIRFYEDQAVNVVNLDLALDERAISLPFRTHGKSPDGHSADAETSIVAFLIMRSDYSCVATRVPSFWPLVLCLDSARPLPSLLLSGPIRNNPSSSPPPPPPRSRRQKVFFRGQLQRGQPLAPHFRRIRLWAAARRPDKD